MSSLLFFLLAVTLLVAVHEYGHYRVAVACGVRVERFSIGLGPVLWRWRARRPRPGQDTEFVISALPLGGYVRMLDETNEPVPEHLRAMAFNRQSVGRRALIVLAGPLANLLLAWVLWAVLAMVGQYEPRPTLAMPAQGSLLAQAGVQPGDTVLAIQAGDTEVAIKTLDDWWLQLSKLGGSGDPIVLRVQGLNQVERLLRLDLSRLETPLDDPQGPRALGWNGLWSPPVLGSLVPGGQAEREGLQAGDRVIAIDGIGIRDAAELRLRIRQSVKPDGTAMPRDWLIQRNGLAEPLTMAVEPRVIMSEGQRMGRLDVMVGAAPAQVWVRHGFLQAWIEAGRRCLDMIQATLSVLGRMLIGEASWSQISGPVTMADYAGKSAQLGWEHFVKYLVWVSLSLGILNLLPIPVLDGGHLMCYLYEWVTGRPVSPRTLSFLQRLGMVLIVALMFLALHNDVSRWLGQG
ncbi:MAG: metalloprotease RseP [Pseudomonadota bacterium]|jgi:regulator of sigma E protease